MISVCTRPELPSIETDMTAQFRQELSAAAFHPVPWVEGIKVDLEAASSISLTPGVNTVLAVMAVAEAAAGGATFGIPAINPLDPGSDTIKQVPHHIAVDTLRGNLRQHISDYLSLYIWKTARHTQEFPELVGLCYGHDFSPPYKSIRRVHLEKVVRETSFLRLFAADYTFKKKAGGKICTLTEFK